MLEETEHLCPKFQQVNAESSNRDSHVGTIHRIDHCPSIVLVLLKCERGWLVPIPFDHRCFQNMLDAESCTSDELIGRPGNYVGDVLRLD